MKKNIRYIKYSHGRKKRAMYAKILYDYMATNALDFICNFKNYKEIVIKKAYELKTDPDDVPELIESIDNFLRIIGETSNNLDELYLTKEVQFQEDNERIHDKNLIKTIALKIGFKDAVDNPEKYLKRYIEEIHTDTEKKEKEIVCFLERVFQNATIINTL